MAAFVQGYRWVMVLASLLAIAGAAVAIVWLKPVRTKSTAER